MQPCNTYIYINKEQKIGYVRSRSVNSFHKLRTEEIIYETIFIDKKTKENYGIKWWTKRW